jgi:signal transduction histidine kinase
VVKLPAATEPSLGMTSPLLDALTNARAALASAATAEPGEAAVARRLARELDEAIARLAGGPAERDLLSIVCHDLKDPLASIVMGAGFLKKTISAEDSTRRVIDAIARSANRMTQVVGDFHDLARLEAGTLLFEPRPCDFGAAVRATVDTFASQAREKGVGLELQAPSEAVMGSCDRARLGQMVSKLLGNAIKFTDAGGTVLVRVSAHEADAVVSVRDTGRGIAQDALSAIFDRAANARRTPRDGPGLGLAIVRGLAELQGGRVAVESRLGEGSTFTISLPRC